MKLIVKDHNQLVRDADNLAILNRDPNVLRRHEQKIAALAKEKAMEAKLNILEQDMSEIKGMLAQLIKSNNQ